MVLPPSIFPHPFLFFLLVSSSLVFNLFSSYMHIAFYLSTTDYISIAPCQLTPPLFSSHPLTTQGPPLYNPNMLWFWDGFSLKSDLPSSIRFETLYVNWPPLSTFQLLLTPTLRSSINLSRCSPLTSQWASRTLFPPFPPPMLLFVGIFVVFLLVLLFMCHHFCCFCIFVIYFISLYFMLCLLVFMSFSLFMLLRSFYVVETSSTRDSTQFSLVPNLDFENVFPTQLLTSGWCGSLIGCK